MSSRSTWQLRTRQQLVAQPYWRQVTSAPRLTAERRRPALDRLLALALGRLAGNGGAAAGAQRTDRRAPRRRARCSPSIAGGPPRPDRRRRRRRWRAAARWPSTAPAYSSIGG